MKRCGKGIYEVPGGTYYRASAHRTEHPAELIVRAPADVLLRHRFDNHPAVMGTPESIREFGVALIEAAAHAAAAEVYGKAFDGALVECETACMREGLK